MEPEKFSEFDHVKLRNEMFSKLDHSTGDKKEHYFIKLEKYKRKELRLAVEKQGIAKSDKLGFLEPMFLGKDWICFWLTSHEFEFLRDYLVDKEFTHSIPTPISPIESQSIDDSLSDDY